MSQYTLLLGNYVSRFIGQDLLDLLPDEVQQTIPARASVPPRSCFS